MTYDVVVKMISTDVMSYVTHQHQVEVRSLHPCYKLHVLLSWSKNSSVGMKILSWESCATLEDIMNALSGDAMVNDAS